MIYLYFLLALFISLCLFSIYSIRTGKNTAKFIYGFGFPLGSFVWEDLFVFCIYFTVLTLIAILNSSTKIFLLGFSIFWLVRSVGETIYWFLQQFIVPTHYPHNVSSHLKTMHLIFGNISDQQGMILLQVMFQVITMASIFGIIYLLQH